MSLSVITTGRIISAALLAVLLIGFGLGYLRDSEPAEYHLYIIDEREDRTSPLDLAVLDAALSQSTKKWQWHRLSSAAIAPYDTTSALMVAASKPPATEAASPLFFNLQRPYMETEKRLRVAIEQRLTGEARVTMLELEANFDDVACDRLRDDSDYAKWNYGGIGLRVTEASLPDLRQCLLLFD